MFQGFTGQTIDFMWNIRFNNEKTWFEAHKDEYKTVLAQPMTQLAQETAAAFEEKFSRLGLSVHVSRIYRDARRLHGRGPYKDHLWFTLRREEEQWPDSPVFWFELGPEKCTYGLGYYSARADTMAKHRARIDNNPKALEKLFVALSKQNAFVLEGENYARPKDCSNKALWDWYNKKTFSLIHEEEITEALFSPELKTRVIEGFSFLVPFYEYFSTLRSDPDPRYN